MHPSKKVLFSLFILLYFIGPLAAQIPSNPFMQPDVENHDFHRKCGIDHAIEARMANDPNYAEEVKQFKKSIPTLVEKARENASRSGGSSFIINVPIVVHVIHTGQPVGSGMNISDAQIEAQINVLNDDFNALNSNYNETPTQWLGAIGNPELNFCLAAIDPDGNPTNGITRHNMTVTGTDIDDSNIESEIKPATWWDSDEYYNIWVLPIPGTAPSGGTTGYAYFPTGGVVGTSTDGSVVDHDWFGGPGFLQSGEKTLTHETGHYLGLPHTFDVNEACATDDGFADTPDIGRETAFYQPNLSCNSGSFPAGPTSCGNQHMYVNYMDYVNDDYCVTSFSNEQIALMRAILLGNTSGTGFVSRAPLANNASSVCSFFDNDAGLTQINNPETFVCGGGQITPEVIITNFGQSNLNSVTINYQINNNAPVTLVWATNLETAETETVTLAPYTPPAGNYTFTAFTTLPNGSVDEQIENDSSSVSTTAVVPLPLPLQENFEDPSFNPTINGVFTFDITGDGVVWQRSTAASGFGNGTASAMFDNYSTQRPNGTIDAMICPIYDFTGVTGAQVTFDVGYAIYQGGGSTLTDTLIMIASTNCGINFTQQIYVKGGAELATAPATSGLFTPTATQWRTETVDLSAFDGMDNLSLMFVNYHGYGNRMFIDNINISLPCDMTVAQAGTDPFCFDSCDGEATVTPTGGSGSYTYTWSANAGGATGPTATNLCGGDYMVTVSDGGTCSEILTITLNTPSPLTAMVTSTNETGVGANDGTATATPSGGNASSYSFIWSNTEITQTITNLAPGPYTVTVTDASGCSLEEMVTIAPYDCGTYGITVSGTEITCNGEENGTVSAEVNTGAGTMPFTYNWSNSAGNVTMIDNLAAGEYFVTITDAAGCSAEGSYEILEPEALTVSVSTTDETTAGANDGTATATPMGGTPFVTLLWSNAANTGLINNLSPGPYSVTATDSEGCTATATGVVNSGSVDCSGFSISVQSSNDVDCNGTCNGNISLAVNSTATPFTFDWNDDALDGTQNPMNLCVGSYSVTVTDNDGCSASLTQNITEPEVLSATIVETPETCFGLCDGAIDVQPTGGTAPYDVDIEGGSFTTLCAGNFYLLTITDAEGCTYEETITTTSPPADEILLDHSDVSCFGDCDGIIGIDATNNEPYSYEWSDGFDESIQGDLCAGTYTITVTNNNGCTTVITETIEEPSELTIAITTTPLSGAGANDATATATAAGGGSNYNYAWQPNGENTPMIGPLGPGTYTVVVTDDNGCTASESIVINSFDCGTFLATITAFDVLCNGACDGSMGTTVMGGTPPMTYNWSDPNYNGQANPIDLCPGTYSVTITESNGCSAILSETITEPAPLAVVVTGTNPSGPGAMDGSATANPTGGMTAYTYLWSPTGEETATINNLSAGTYVVTITDLNGCTATDNIVFQDVDCSTFSLALDIINVSCFEENDGTATAIASGGAMPYTYIWGTSAIGPSIVNLGPGTYDVVVSDDNGCTIQETFEITEPDLLSANGFVVTNETTAGANDGTITVVGPIGGTPPYALEWCDGSTGTTVENLPPGLCSLLITDSNGCTSTSSAVVSPETADCSTLSATVSTESVLCFGESNGTANVVVSGGTMPMSFEWSNGGMAEAIFNLSSGPYQVTITDANDCEFVAEGFVETPNPLEVNVTTTNETTPGANDGTATANPSGGTSPYTFSWCNGATTNPVLGLPAGSCSLTVTDATGCTQEVAVIIGSDAVDCSSFEATFLTSDVSCFGGTDGSAITELTGGAPGSTFNWSNGGSAPGIISVPAGEYSVTILDGNDCVLMETVEITGPDQIIIATTSTPESTAGANDGTATATATTGGTAPYTYEWCNGDNTEMATNLPAGNCSVTITDMLGCTEVSSVMISTGNVDCSDFSVSISSNSTTCNGGADGTASATVSGGIEPYFYNWNNSEMTPSISGLSQGNYTVTVIDGNNCEFVASVVVNQPPPLAISLSTTDETSIGANDGTATAIPLGGTPGYSFSWCNGQTGNMATNLSPGICVVTLTDANNCTVEEIFVITEGTVDCNSFAVALVTEAVTCFSFSDGLATAVVTGGLAPFTYNWSNGMNLQTISNLPAGPYELTVTDANDCEVVQIGVVSQPQAIIANSTTTPETVSGASDGTAMASPTGGIPPYSYLWCDGQVTETAVNLAGGNCGLTITDNIGCSIIEEVFIETIPNSCDGYEITLTMESISCFGSTDGTAEVQPVGGTTPYTYNWSNGGNTPMIMNLTAGLYSVTVTDALNCELIESIVVPQPFEIQLTTTGYDGNCGGNASALATATGGTAPFTYNWSNGMATDFIDGLSSGVYQVTATDANACTAVEVVQVLVNTQSISIESNVNAVSCSGEEDGNIDITVMTGLPPFSFTWSTGETTEDLFNRPPGTYTVFIIDAANCLFTSTFTIGTPPALTVEFVISPADNGSNGSASAIGIGGSAPYSYDWSIGSQSVTIAGLTSGTYSVTITDANGCTGEGSVFVGTSAVDDLATLASFNLFPNPTDGAFRIEAQFAEMEEVEVLVYNVLGQVVFYRKANGREFDMNIDIRSKASGTYLLQLKTDRGALVRKVVKR